jgi:ferredoxin
MAEKRTVLGDAASTAPTMAALRAVAAEPVPDIAFVSLDSDGVVLIYGRDEAAIEAGTLLADHLDVTVMIAHPENLRLPRAVDFPVVQGKVKSAKGHLGDFEIVVDGYAQPLPSPRGALTFGQTRDGATSNCDLIFDLSGGAPLFSAPDLRDGYLRADPGDPAAVLRAVLKARDLTGTFDKPRYITFTEDLCAHSRSRIVGCHRCLDLCPAGAITPNGDRVSIDAKICASCCRPIARRAAAPRLYCCMTRPMAPI